MRLIDTHCHLHMDYYDEDRDEVIRRCAEDGLVFVLTVGISASDSERAVMLSERYPFIYAAVGVHPHDAKSATEADFEKIERLSRIAKVLAIGEIGLDFYRNLSPKEDQIRVFEALLLLAERLAMPVVIHTRNAHPDTKRILKKYSVKGVIHCFSGTAKDAAEYLDMGFYISFAGNLTYNKDLEDAARYVPLEKILVETDAPFLTPAPLRGRRNEPRFVKYTAERLAALKNIRVEELWERIFANAFVLFNLNPEGSGRYHEDSYRLRLFHR